MDRIRKQARNNKEAQAELEVLEKTSDRSG